MRSSSSWRWAVIVGFAACAGAASARPPLTVGPHGTYSTLQAALRVAAPLTGITELRLESATFDENVSVGVCCTGNVLIWGGWDATFTTHSSDPRLTVVDGRLLGRAMNVDALRSGTLTLQGLSLRNGRLSAVPPGALPALGAGLFVSVAGTGSLTLRGVYIHDNGIRADRLGDSEGQGGGACILLNDTASVLIQSSVFEANSIAESVAGASLNSHGGGLELQVFGGSATIASSIFRGNAVTGSDVARGGGLSLLVQGLPGLGATLVGNTFDRNLVAAGGSSSGADLSAYDGHGSPNLVARRNVFKNNTGGYEQVEFAAVGGAYVEVSDTTIYAGDHDGLHVFGNGGYAYVANVTAADNAGLGVQAQAVHAKVAVFNTIAFGNGGGDLRLSGDLAFGGFNLVGVDPQFNDPAAGDYRLRPSSPARNAGTNAPPGGLGPSDGSGGPRIVDGTVDIGADEID